MKKDEETNILKYFIVTNEEEGELYNQTMNTNIKKCQYMKEKLKKAIDEQYYRDL